MRWVHSRRPARGGGGRGGGSFPFFHPNDVIVFQGDSITDGGRQRTGSDFNHIMGQDYAYLLAAEIRARYPQRSLTFINRGVGGDRVVDLAARWQADTLALKPNLLSILVGVNDSLADAQKKESVAQFEATYNQLLAQTTAALPNTKIILGSPFLLPVRAHKASYENDLGEVQKRQAAVARLATKFHLPLILYQEVFDRACRQAPADHWSWDGVHPTYAGHPLMMQAWLRTANRYWPKG